MQFYEFANTDLLNHEFALQISSILHKAILTRGHAYLVVSGGKTPVDLFQSLAKTSIAWEKVTVILADERCVDMEAQERNETLVRRYLLQENAKTATCLTLYDKKTQMTSDLSHIEHSIAALPTFDVVILGMGEDGHTASLFPCSPELSQGLAEDAPAVLFVNPNTAPFKRVSLSKSRLLNAHHLFIHLVGLGKRSVLDKAMAEDNESIMPIRAFLHQAKIPVQIMYANA